MLHHQFTALQDSPGPVLLPLPAGLLAVAAAAVLAAVHPVA
jgi:hypothetical protein